jgi:translation initiation factor 2B subunit (eIF-2B alpha/beta/delta family)
MTYIRGGSDYAMIQSQAAMLKHLWEQDRKQKELLKRAYKLMASTLNTAPLFEDEIEERDKLLPEIKEAIKA